MNTLQTLDVFLRVAQMKSFTKAADSLGLSRATVSRLVAGLEESLGKPLLIRTTRRVALTDAGQDFYERAERLSYAAQELLAPADDNAPLSGLLRIAATPGLAEFFLGQVVENFACMHPLLSIELRIEATPVDLVATATDLAFSVANTPTDDAVVLGRCSSWLCASPEYLEKAGLPTTPEALVNHDLVVQPWVDIWTMANAAGETRRVKLKSRLKFSSVNLVIAAVKRGRGIGLLPNIAAAQEVAANRLVRLLPDWSFPESKIFIRRAPGRIAHRAAEAFVAFVKSQPSRSKIEKR